MLKDKHSGLAYIPKMGVERREGEGKG